MSIPVQGPASPLFARPYTNYWEVMIERDPRGLYLKKIGLAFDPFRASVAEQELGTSSEVPKFYTFYSSPELRTGDHKTVSLRDLRQAQHAFIYGKPGAGKTTLRLNLDAACRTIFDQTLVVNDLLGEDVQAALTSDEHALRLARMMAIDIFIQFLEQYHPSETPDQQLFPALLRLLDTGGMHLKRLVRSILADPRPEARAGIAMYWPIVGKSPVRYTAASDGMIRILKALLGAGEFDSPPQKPWEVVWAVRQAAQVLGFKRILVLVDGVDSRHRSRRAMLDLLSPLLEKLEACRQHQIFIKFFLPVELQQDVDGWLLTNQPEAFTTDLRATIQWTDDALKAVLIQRLAAAGGRLKGFDELAGMGLELDLDRRIITRASQSPRHMIQVVSALLDAHVANRSGQVKIDLPDWDLMDQLWQTGESIEDEGSLAESDGQG